MGTIQERREVKAGSPENYTPEEVQNYLNLRMPEGFKATLQSSKRLVLFIEDPAGFEGTFFHMSGRFPSSRTPIEETYPMKELEKYLAAPRFSGRPASGRWGSSTSNISRERKNGRSGISP